MEIHHLSALRENGKAYVEFFRTKALSTGVYILPAGGVDAQTPHGIDLRCMARGNERLLD